ncbi:hypothetical protein B0O80DRAFT_475921 [Mortierella sp. GBAus27b]|nr:hypothetical protein B0O80DRAFT_475921 [Mortierella sp. GBAus27b]
MSPRSGCTFLVCKLDLPNKDPDSLTVSEKGHMRQYHTTLVIGIGSGETATRTDDGTWSCSNCVDKVNANTKSAMYKHLHGHAQKGKKRRLEEESGARKRVKSSQVQPPSQTDSPALSQLPTPDTSPRLQARQLHHQPLTSRASSPVSARLSSPPASARVLSPPASAPAQVSSPPASAPAQVSSPPASVPARVSSPPPAPSPTTSAETHRRLKLVMESIEALQLSINEMINNRGSQLEEMVSRISSKFQEYDSSVTESLQIQASKHKKHVKKHDKLYDSHVNLGLKYTELASKTTTLDTRQAELAQKVDSLDEKHDRLAETQTSYWNEDQEVKTTVNEECRNTKTPEQSEKEVQEHQELLTKRLTQLEEKTSM